MTSKSGVLLIVGHKLSLIYPSYLHSVFQENYRFEKNSPKADLQISLRESPKKHLYFELKTMESATLFVPTSKQTDFRYINYHLKFLIELLLSFKIKTAFFHASALQINGQAHLFCGQSGAGKSTLLNYASGQQVLADDLAVIKQTPAGLYFYQLPLEKYQRELNPASAIRLRSIYFITQSPTDKLTDLSQREKYHLLQKANFLSFFLNNYCRQHRSQILPSGVNNILKAKATVLKTIIAKTKIQTLFLTKSSRYLKLIS